MDGTFAKQMPIITSNNAVKNAFVGEVYFQYRNSNP